MTNQDANVEHYPGKPRDLTTLAGVHFVCAKLLLSGYVAYLFDHDVLIDFETRLIRVQVKSCLRPTNVNARGKGERIAYNFNLRRRGKNGQRRLSNEQCDLVALVALDIHVIAYLPLSKATMTCQLSPPGYKFDGKLFKCFGRIDEFPLTEALSCL